MDATIAMLLSIARARVALSLFWLSVAGTTAAALAMFLFPLFGGQLPTVQMLLATVVAALIGLMLGSFLTYRSTFDSSYGVGVFVYWIILMELLAAGGAAALAAQVGGRPDLLWFAFVANAFCMVLSLLGGMYREAKALGWRLGDVSHPWRESLEKYIDYSKSQVRPELTNGATDQTSVIKSPMWIVAVGATNIPLLFELFAGGRNNAIFLVVPVLTGTLAYVNVKTIGPGLVRLLLLRKLEKAAGRRFVNADIEQIQDLRRGFFLSRWLMKDFAVAKPGSAASVAARQRKRRT